MRRLRSDVGRASSTTAHGLYLPRRMSSIAARRCGALWPDFSSLVMRIDFEVCPYRETEEHQPGR